MSMNTQQQIRAAAIQAAASLATTTSVEEALETARIFESYINRTTQSLVPEEDGQTPSDAQNLAEKGQSAQSRAEVVSIQEEAKSRGLLQTSVTLGEWTGTLRDGLAHYWKQLPPENQQPREGLRSELGL